MISYDTFAADLDLDDKNLSDTSMSGSYYSIPQSLSDQLDASFSSVAKNFNILHINAQSIPSHFSDFLSSFTSSHIHAVLVSETFLKPSLPSTSYCLPGFHLIRNDRTGKGGGGVAIYIRSHIPFTVLDRSPSEYSESSEHLFIEVLFGHLKLLLGVMYSPSLHIDYFDTLESLLEQYSIAVDHTIIMGDFNTCLIKDDHRARKLKNIVNCSNLNILPTNATHYSPHCTPSMLDLMIVSSLNHVDIHGQLPAEAFSYHDLIFMSYRIRPPKAKPTIVMRRNFSKFNNLLFMSDLNKIDWTVVSESNSMDEKINIFNSLTMELFDKHAPLRPIKLKHLPAPWLTPEIKALMNKRNKAKSKYKLQPTDANLAKYKLLRNRCSKICRDAQRNFIHKSIENANTSKTWRFLNTLGIGRQQGYAHNHLDLNALNRHFTTVTVLDNQEKQKTLDYLKSLPVPDYAPFQFSEVTVDTLKKHVLAIRSDAVGSDGISRRMILTFLDNITPVLCHLFNFSLSSGVFPTEWRNAFVVPIPKTPNPLSPLSFRPISILPFLSKVLERIVNQQLSLFITTNNILSPFQSGFRPGHSTSTALIKVCDDIRQGISNKLVTILVLLDFSNAFTNVDFDLLLELLRSLKVSEGVVSWFRSYLCGRQQCVRFDGKCSAFYPLSAGVPQGGILSPLLFSMFINTISSVISSSFHFYADDLQIYSSGNVDDIPNIVSSLNLDLVNISGWCKSYGLKVNPIKSQVIVIGSSQMLSRISSLPGVYFDGIALEFKPAVKNLGLILDSALSWGPQVDEVGRRIFATLGYLRRWKNLLPFETKIMLANSLLLPILDYGDACYPDLSQELLNKLDRLQNMCIRFIFGLRKFDHISQFRTQLKWLPINRRRDMHTLALLYSILYCPQTPLYLKERFSYLGQDSWFNLRSSKDNKLQTPYSRTKYYNSSFTVNSVKLWNSLPAHIRHSKSLGIFKSRLKNYYLSM